MTTASDTHTTGAPSSFDRVFDELRGDPRLASRIIVRSHPENST